MFKSLSLPICRMNLWSILICGAYLVNACIADDVTVQQGDMKVVKSGTVKFENNDQLILETETGAWLRYQKRDVLERTKKAAPAFLPPAEIAEKLLGLKSDDPLTRIQASPEVIVVLHLERPLPEEHERRAGMTMKYYSGLVTQAAGESIDTVDSTGQ